MVAFETRQPDGRPRGRYPTGFPIRCTEAEKQEIFARAMRANRSASRFVVELAMADGSNGMGGRLPKNDLEVVEGLIVQLRRLASNLHALASLQHDSPMTGSAVPSPAEIDQAVLEVRDLLDQLRSHLA